LPAVPVSSSCAQRIWYGTGHECSKGSSHLGYDPERPIADTVADALAYWPEYKSRATSMVRNVGLTAHENLGFGARLRGAPRGHIQWAELAQVSNHQEGGLDGEGLCMQELLSRRP